MTPQPRGKLKIFFGMASGVGKTYAMLESGHERHGGGIDVVIGYLESHGRRDTESKAEGLESIPVKTVDIEGICYRQPDIDAIIARRPQLVLIDELAHSNAPGSTHPKRYMDIFDLLTAGIDVYTTVNVLHIESRADAVEQITGFKVPETLPDLVIDLADEIELIDLEPDELIKRLREGKFSAPDLVLQKFFRKGNLTALREMALRLTAERVDVQLQDYKVEKQITKPWKSAERLMVCVSASPLSERLIRWTRRMAYNLEAPWIAVYVEPLTDISDAAKQQLARNLSLVHRLDGEVITTSGSDPAAAIIRIAHQRDITQIVVGKPLRPRWQEGLNNPSLVDRLVKLSGGVDVTVITGDPDEASPRPPLRSAIQPSSNASLSQYLLAVLVVIGAVGTLAVLETWPPFHYLLGDYRTIAIILLFIVVMLANFLERSPILVAAILSALLWNVLFINPRYTITIDAPGDVLLFVMYLLIVAVMGNLTARARNEGKVAREREARMSALYVMANQIAEANTLSDVVRIGIAQTGQVFDAQIAIFVPGADGTLDMALHPANTLKITPHEAAIASAAFARREPTGKSTDTLAVGAEAFYLPLNTPGGVAGVMGVKPRDSAPLSVDQRNLLETFTNHIGLAVERELLNMRAQQSALLAESEKLYAALLDSISHELRTPLTAIRAATGTLLDPAIQADPRAFSELGQDVLDATDRMNRLVQNLLDMSRLQAGRIRPKREPCDVRDLIGVTVGQLTKELAQRPLRIEIAPDLPLVSMDSGLMEHVLLNLMLNATLYTPPGLPISISAAIQRDQVILKVADQGPGIPTDFIASAFDKFTRAPGSRAGGTGLGLSICKGFVEAQGGTITVENLATGGACFTISLPAMIHPLPLDL